jgi:hypothetical protein
MKQIIPKLKILLIILMSAFDEWKTQVYPRDIDGHYCCNGDYCGCGGMTIRELYSIEINKPKSQETKPRKT